MERKIIAFQTISTGDIVKFNNAVSVLIKEGYAPYQPIQVTMTPPVYGEDGRFNCGPRTLFTQQFAKYDKEAISNYKCPCQICQGNYSAL